MVHSIHLFVFLFLVAAEVLARGLLDERVREEVRLWSGLDARRTAAGVGLPGGTVVRAWSPAWEAVVVGAGVGDGMRPGLRLTALRSDRPLARFRVVETRRSVSAAVLERRLSAGYEPRPGDRLVVTEKED